MFLPACCAVNELGHLTVSGCDTVELATRFGTPLYVMDEATIRRACRLYRTSFERYYEGKGCAFYASKALCCKALCRIMAEEGLGLDVVSYGEFYTALCAGFPASKIHFHGNNKADEEIRFALEHGMGRFVVDNLSEMERLQHFAEEAGKTAEIALRIKPGVDAHTHEFIRTGQIDSKFGFALETGEAMEAVRAACRQPNLILKEVHSHIGSQIFEIEPFVHTSEIMMDFIAAVHRELPELTLDLNLGGGFGISYVEDDSPLSYDEYMKAISVAVRRKAEEYGLPVPVIHIEPGRSIVGEAGITLYTVGSVKKIPGIRTYVAVNGGMTDNPRYALYHADYTAMIANRAAEPADQMVTIAGKCCESGDLIQENVMLQKAQPEDVLAVFSTGAYNYSMASNYNRNPRPAMVMIGEDGEAQLIIRRESLEDLVRNDI